MYRHVLVAVDLVDADVAVLNAAAKLTAANGCPLTVLHVCDPHVSGYSEGISRHHIANEMQVKQQCFPRLKDMITATHLEHCEKQLLFGNPADVIHNYAIEHDCDLIVVGSHGYSGVKALLGSTANKVLQGASCDVYTVHLNEQ